MRKQRVILAILAVLLLAGTTLAREIVQGRQCHINANQTIHGTLFVFCEELTVAGRVEGHVFGGAIRADITGEVTGNLYLLSFDTMITGMIEGDVHFIGAMLDVHLPETSDTDPPANPLNGSLLNATLSTVLGEDVVIPGSITQVGYQLVVEGEVQDEVNFWGSALIIDGPIDNRVYATVGDPESDGSQIETILIPFGFDVELRNPGLVIAPDGQIAGALTYIGPTEAIIEGEVNGRIDYTEVIPLSQLPTSVESDVVSTIARNSFREFSTLLVIGVLGLVFAPRWLLNPITHLRSRPISSLSVGMLSFILSFPIFLIMLLLSAALLVGLWLIALDGVLVVTIVVLATVNLAGISLFYLGAIFIARVIVALAIGRFLVRRVWGSNQGVRVQYVCMGIGTLIIAILASIPAIGWIINAVALFLGLGALLTLLIEYFGQLRESSFSGEWSITAPINRVPSPLRQQIQSENPVQLSIPPPPDDPPPAPPGMTNLPPGFDPDFFKDN